jgi:ABC-2 type transport system ATP-binding protein
MTRNGGGILVDNVSKAFRKKQVLKDIRFAVKRGELFGFLGPNGAGKTTTMRIILGLLNADSGSALIDGTSFRADPSVRRRTGVLLEGHGLYEDMTLSDNIRYYASLNGAGEREAARTIRRVGLAGSADEKVGNFSSGMKKKAALARALVHEPEYLFLDEPTSGLDPEAQIDFRELIGSLSRERGITLFLNSHNLDEVQKICTQVAIISGGSILVSDSLAGLQRQYSEPAVYITLYSEEDALRLDALLKNNNTVVRTEVRGKQIEAVLREDNFTLQDVLAYGVDVKEFTSRVKSLEEVYMEIV